MMVSSLGKLSNIKFFDCFVLKNASHNMYKNVKICRDIFIYTYASHNMYKNVKMCRDIYVHIHILETILNKILVISNEIC